MIATISIQVGYSLMTEAQPREIQRYITADGKIPFAKWFDSLKDTQGKYRIDLRMNRLQLGGKSWRLSFGGRGSL